MPHIRLRLMGFGDKASGISKETRPVVDGASVEDIWADLKTDVQYKNLSRMNEKNISILLNGKLIQWKESSQAVLEEGDVLTFMVLAIGG